MVSKALGKIHLQNYGEIVRAFLFSIAGSQEVLLNNRQAEKGRRTQFALHPLSNGPKDGKEHHKAGRKEGEKTGSLHATVLEHGTEEEYGITAGITWYPSLPFVHSSLVYFKDPVTSPPYISQ